MPQSPHLLPRKYDNTLVMSIVITARKENWPKSAFWQSTIYDFDKYQVKVARYFSEFTCLLFFHIGLVISAPCTVCPTSEVKSNRRPIRLGPLGHVVGTGADAISAGRTGARS